MRIFTRLVSIFGAVAAVMLIAIGAPVNAQSQNSGSGIFISPVRTELVINPGETKTVTVTIKNFTNANATYKAIINDFIAGDNEFG